MATTFPMANPWVDGEQMNAAKLYARVTQAINDLAQLTAYDTGWLPLASLATGWGTAGGGAFARFVGGVVYLSGYLNNSTFTGGYTTVAQLPDGIPSPLRGLAAAVATNAAVSRAVQVSATGAVQLYSSAASASNFGLAGLSYPIG